jgi:hypothetical protein
MCLLNMNLEKKKKKLEFTILDINVMEWSCCCLECLVGHLSWFKNLACLTALEHLHRCSICDLGEIFFTSKFSSVLFCNPTNKTETGTANRGGRLLRANHLDQSL